MLLLAQVKCDRCEILKVGAFGWRACDLAGARALTQNSGLSVESGRLGDNAHPLSPARYDFDDEAVPGKSSL
jgi:hypothetical protein